MSTTKVISLDVVEMASIISELEFVQKIPSIHLAVFSNKNLQKLQEIISNIRKGYDEAMQNVEKHEEYKEKLREVAIEYGLLDENGKSKVVDGKLNISEDDLQKFEEDKKKVDEEFSETVKKIKDINDEYEEIVTSKMNVEVDVASIQHFPQEITGESIKNIVMFDLIE
jgi:predicted nuclease with TOPRIM domain